MSQVTTHVLDTSLGRPAAAIPVALARRTEAGPWIPLATGVTDPDGRVGDLGPDALEAGDYRITFDTAEYFAANGTTPFFPEVTVTFSVVGAEHYHVPLLLSPFGYSTYRGS